MIIPEEQFSSIWYDLDVCIDSKNHEGNNYGLNLGFVIISYWSRFNILKEVDRP